MYVILTPKVDRRNSGFASFLGHLNVLCKNAKLDISLLFESMDGRLFVYLRLTVKGYFTPESLKVLFLDFSTFGFSVSLISSSQCLLYLPKPFLKM